MKRFRRLTFAAAALPLLLLTDRIPLTPAHQAEWLSAGDVHVRALRVGTGDTTVVMLHGYGESLLAYRSLIDPLSREYRVIALDLPGFGVSENPADGFDLAAARRRVEAFLDQWTEGPLVLVGHSMGGEIAAALALSHPRVKSLVLVAPAGAGVGIDVAALNPAAARTLGVVFSAAGYLLPVHDRGWLASPSPRATYDPFVDGAHRRAAAATLTDFDFAALAGQFERITQPTLLLWGGLDPTIPVAIGRGIADELPCRRFVLLPRQLHRPVQTATDTVLSEIRTFLRAPRCEATDTRERG